MWNLLGIALSLGGQALAAESPEPASQSPRRSLLGEVSTPEQRRDAVRSTPLLPPLSAPTWVRATVLSSYILAIGAASGGAWAFGVGTLSKEPGAVQFGALPLGMGAPLVWTAAAVLAIPSSCLWYAAGRRAHLPYLAGASALLSSVFCWVALDSGDPRDLQRAAGLMVLSSGLLVVEGISLSGALWEQSQQGVDLRVLLSPEGARGELTLRF